MSYPSIPSHVCPYCLERFLTPYALVSHNAQKHYQSPCERDEKFARIKLHSERAKQSRLRNGTPSTWIKGSEA